MRKHDRSGQMWSLDTGDDGAPIWSPFLIVSTRVIARNARESEFEPYDSKKRIEHQVIVSDQFERTIVVNLNEDPDYLWETCEDQYRRIV